MLNYLVKHALKNVWCTPDQDYQFIFNPAKLTGPRGVVNQVKVEWQTIRLPSTNDTYHVYQIGQLNPKVLGLFYKCKTWTSFQDICNSNNAILDVYTNKGIQIPRYETFLKVTENRNLIIAVKQINRIVDLSVEKLFFRFYSNSFFSSERSHPTEDRIFVKGYTFTSVSSFLLFQREYHDLKLLIGQVYLFWNGVMVDDVLPTEVKVGDRLEFVYDSTIRQQYEFPINELDVFVSSLDNKRKYLIHLPKKENDRIEYRDDIDIFILNKNGVKFKGLYYHKNSNESVRMVTHNDYSLPVQHLISYVDNDIIKNIEDCFIRIHVRESGYNRPLVHENNRIHELYKMSDEDIVRALIGIDSTVDNWKASTLENSHYTKIMDSDGLSVTSLKVQQAYGYNAISKLVADTPNVLILDSGLKTTTLPTLTSEKSTVFEYDLNGLLLGFYYHFDQLKYFARNNNSSLIEAIVGIGGSKLTTAYDVDDYVLDSNYNHRYYKCRLIQDTPSNNWVYAEEGVDYRVFEGKVEWLLDKQQWYTAIRDDSHFLAYSFEMTPNDGLLHFNVVAEEKRTDGNWYSGICYIPMGDIDIWLNGRSLIRGLDYFINWPEVVITNKEYWVEGPQTITIRATGFSNELFDIRNYNEFGYVEHGLLSRNKRFDVRDDKITRIVVGGKVKQLSDLHFAENHNGVIISDVKNGTPYSIRDVIVPIKTVGDEDTYSLKEKSLVIDKKISDYLTLKLPEPIIDEISPIEERYMIYSPFCSKIIHDFINGYFYPEKIKSHYNEMDIKNWLKEYEWLLNFEPIRKDVDERYVCVHPHHLFNVIELDIYQYMFMERVVKLYLDNKVDLSSFIKVKEGWL